MNSLFDRLADISLRRIYKFVLKKLIGEYLNEELLIEQFVVESRVGLVSIHDLDLNVGRINEEITRSNGGVPLAFVVKSIRVSSLQAKIQYSTILTEGISLHANGIAVDIVPNRSKPRTTESGDFTAARDSTRGGDGTERTDAAAAAPDGGALPAASAAADGDSMSDTDLSFIAEWVDIILSRLVVTVEDVRVTVFGEDPHPNSTDETEPDAIGGSGYKISDKYVGRSRSRRESSGRQSRRPVSVALQLSVGGLTFHYTHPSDMTSYSVTGATGQSHSHGGNQGMNRSVTFQLPGSSTGGGGSESTQYSIYRSGYDRARKGERRLLQVQRLCARLLLLGSSSSSPSSSTAPLLGVVGPYPLRIVKETLLVQEVDFTTQLQQRLVADKTSSSSRRRGGVDTSGHVSVANLSMSTGPASSDVHIVNDVDVSFGEMVMVSLPLSDLAAVLRLAGAYSASAVTESEACKDELSLAASLTSSYAVAPTVNTVNWLEQLCAHSTYNPASVPLGVGDGAGGVSDAVSGGNLDEKRLEKLLQQVRFYSLSLLCCIFPVCSCSLY